MENLYKKESYRELVIKNNNNTLEFLLKEGIDFAIVAYVNAVEFKPQIPASVIEFDKAALFMIAGYSKESAYLGKEQFHFEAGFGQENFGSMLTIPLEAIAQIIIEEDIVIFSHYEPQEKKEPQNSMELLLNNPENQNLLKKVQKGKKS